MTMEANPDGYSQQEQPQDSQAETIREMFPFSPQGLDNLTGTLLGKNMTTKMPLMYDPFNPDRMNAHMVVLSRPNGNKSLFVKLLTFRETRHGIPTYLIDTEGEYQATAKALGGEVFTPGMPRHGLNPFFIEYSNMGELAARVWSMASLITMMLGAQVNQDLNAVIDRCLTGFYAQELRNNNNSNTLGEGGMAKFHEYLESDQAAEKGGPRLAHLLSQFATGSARFLMDTEPRNILQDNKPVTLFNLENLPETLKPAATAICAQTVWGLAISTPRPRRLVVDDSWIMLAPPHGPEYFNTILKRARKYQLGILTATQHVQNFLSETPKGVNPSVTYPGHSILQNSATKMALSQDPAALEPLAEALGLNKEIQQFLTGPLTNQGVMVDDQGTMYPVEILSTPLERQMMTPDSPQKMDLP